MMGSFNKICALACNKLIHSIASCELVRILKHRIINHLCKVTFVYLGRLNLTKEKIKESGQMVLLMSVSAWICFLLLLLVLIKGEQILLQVELIYPNLMFPAFFIPWFLLLISTVQNLRNSQSKLALQAFILKTTIPLFIFALPFFSHYLPLGIIWEQLQAYAIYLAIIALFFLHFFPAFKTK